MIKDFRHFQERKVAPSNPHLRCLAKSSKASKLQQSDFKQLVEYYVKLTSRRYKLKRSVAEKLCLAFKLAKWFVTSHTNVYIYLVLLSTSELWTPTPPCFSHRFPPYSSNF